MVRRTKDPTLSGLGTKGAEREVNYLRITFKVVVQLLSFLSPGVFLLFVSEISLSAFPSHLFTNSEGSVFSGCCAIEACLLKLAIVSYTAYCSFFLGKVILFSFNLLAILKDLIIVASFASMNELVVTG